MRGRERAGIGDDAGALPARRIGDAQHRHAVAQLGAARRGDLQLRRDAALGEQDAGVALPVAALVVGRHEGGKALADLGRIEPLVDDAEALGRAHGLLEEAGLAVIRAPRRSLRGDDEAAGREHQAFAGLGLELAPEGVRALHDGHVLVAFADGQPGDARRAVARTMRVRRREAVDADHLRAARGQVMGDGAADGTQADHDHVGAAHRHVAVSAHSDSGSSRWRAYIISRWASSTGSSAAAVGASRVSSAARGPASMAHSACGKGRKSAMAVAA